MSKYHYRVEATRKVRAPSYGPEAYRCSIRIIRIGFGRNELVRTGKEAKELAMIAASALEADSSCVSVFRMSANMGFGGYVKDSGEIFRTDWADGTD